MMRPMPYDEDLAHRVRAQLADEPDVTEKAMFGGLAFLVGGHMAVAASGKGGLMVRVDPAQTDALLSDPGAEPMVMRGRALDGWLLVSPEGMRTAPQVAPWVARGVAFVRTLPAKG